MACHHFCLLPFSFYLLLPSNEFPAQAHVGQPLENRSRILARATVVERIHVLGHLLDSYTLTEGRLFGEQARGLRFQSLTHFNTLSDVFCRRETGARAAARPALH